MRVEQSIEVLAPRERVWEYVASPERYAEFMVGSRWSAIPGEPTSGLRARFSIATEVASVDLGGVIEVIEFDPPHELAWTSVTGIDHRGRWVLRDLKGSTKVTLRVSYQVPGGILALIASRAGAPFIRGDIGRTLSSLKGLVERQS